MNRQRVVVVTTTYNEMGMIIDTKAEELDLSAQPTHDNTSNALKSLDCIDRQAAIDTLKGLEFRQYMEFGEYIGEDTREVRLIRAEKAQDALQNLPSAQPTLYGYNVKHLELIAIILQKENVPPERVVEVLTDIGRIVAIVRNEFEESLRKAVEQCVNK